MACTARTPSVIRRQRQRHNIATTTTATTTAAAAAATTATTTAAAAAATTTTTTRGRDDVSSHYERTHREVIAWEVAVRKLGDERNGFERQLGHHHTTVVAVEAPENANHRDHHEQRGADVEPSEPLLRPLDLLHNAIFFLLLLGPLLWIDLVLLLHLVHLCARLNECRCIKDKVQRRNYTNTHGRPLAHTHATHTHRGDVVNHSMLAGRAFTVNNRSVVPPVHNKLSRQQQQQQQQQPNEASERRAAAAVSVAAVCGGGLLASPACAAGDAASVGACFPASTSGQKGQLGCNDHLVRDLSGTTAAAAASALAAATTPRQAEEESDVFPEVA